MSEHYGTLEGALAYHAARGNAAWAGTGVTDALRSAALVRASTAIDGMYGARFPGHKAGGRVQVLAWPRVGAYDHCAGEDIPDDEVPFEVVNAAYELALAELQSPGVSTPTVTPGQVVASESVGPISTSYFAPGHGAAAGLEAQRAVLFAVEDALRCVLTPRGGFRTGKIVRS